ncbi:hypothetical protein GGI03_001138 [Coemansia sp. RSA 2337]|nr:hypothetical protein LPJ71_000732 [Coemansia sp. S17]KAJ2100658.1 hypothetical protein GGI16_003650 [Coemansia sp. S142-1]KAJ2468190.1 hypothetical protein GGI03_001138 [Coemansia sp. RSA 2337]
MTPSQQFTLFPPLPNTGDIERRTDFEPLGSSSAFTTPVQTGRLPSQYYTDMRSMEMEYAGLDTGSSAGYQQSELDTTPLGQSKNSLELEFQPLEYMDSTSSPPLPPELDGDGVYINGYSTPIPAGRVLERDVEAIDEDFVLNVIQEGELERLTKMAVEETKVAWKQEIMGELRKQTNSLVDDDWMYFDH